MGFEEDLLPLEVVLGGDEIGVCFSQIGARCADIGRLQNRERLALLHLLTELSIDADDPPGDRGKHMPHSLVVKSDLAAHEDRVVDVLLRDRRDLDLGVFRFLRREPHFSWRRLRAGGNRCLRTMAASDCAESKGPYDHHRTQNTIHFIWSLPCLGGETSARWL